MSNKTRSWARTLAKLNYVKILIESTVISEKIYDATQFVKNAFQEER